VPLHSSIVAAVALGAICACTPISSLDVNRAALTDANRRYDAALLSGDAAALQALYADDFQYFGPGNVVRDKAAQVEALTSGKVDLIEGSSSNVEIRIYGATAVLTGRFAGRASVSGREFSFTERYSTVWVRQDGAWRLVLEHGTVIEDNNRAVISPNTSE
jgi:ketosteroid isomerase-like protein